MHVLLHYLEEMMTKRSRNIPVLEKPEICMIQIANTLSVVNLESCDSKRVGVGRAVYL